MPERKTTLQTQFVKVKTSAGATYFVPCEPRDLALYIKCWMGAALHCHFEELRLYLGTRLIEDNASLHDQQVKNGGVLFLARKKANGDFESAQSFLGIETASVTGRFLDSPARTEG
jgi:hypothetical protein